jgi:hypothetical protein
MMYLQSAFTNSKPIVKIMNYKFLNQLLFNEEGKSTIYLCNQNYKYIYYFHIY